MDSFETVFKSGGHTNSLGRSQEVLDLLSHEPTRLDELFECIAADDAWVRMRAIDTFEKLIREHPHLAQPYLPKIITMLTLSEQPSIQWHLAQIFTEVELTDEQRGKAIAWLKQRLASINVDWIVSVNSMKALIYFHAAGYVQHDELKSLLQVQTTHSSSSVRKKATTFLQSL